MNAPAFYPQCQEEKKKKEKKKSNRQYAGGRLVLYRAATRFVFNIQSRAVVGQSGIFHRAATPLLFVMMYWSSEHFSA